MKILSMDIGTGTQDIFLFDSRLDIENGLKMVLPSPTMMIYQKLRQATRQGLGVLLEGVTMGGGPNQWAAQDHMKAGLPIFATPDAARTFNDDLEVIRKMGIQVVSEDEARRLPSSILRMEMKDFDFGTIRRSFEGFGVSLNDLDAIAVAVFDHGEAPPDVSDRKFRFDYLDSRIREENRLSAFAYAAGQIPQFMTRMRAVVKSAKDIDVPLFVMDTAPAAVSGALLDSQVQEQVNKLVVNVGNFHALAFRMGVNGIEGVLEHHTGLLDCEKLDLLLKRLVDGTLTREEVFSDNGHGALIYENNSTTKNPDEWKVVVTGPRRSLLYNSSWHPYFAVPFGDMMMAGCFGMLAALADLRPDWRDILQASLQCKKKDGGNAAPWDIVK